MKRHQLAHFVDVAMSCNKADTEPQYEIIGAGVNSLVEEFNPETESSHWINEESGSSWLKGYTPTIAIERKDCKNDATREWVKHIINDLPTGTDAETYIVRVDLTEAAEDGNEYVAYRRKYVATAGSTGGDAGDYVNDVVNCSGVGDQVKGTFNPTTKTFTEAE